MNIAIGLALSLWVLNAEAFNPFWSWENATTVDLNAIEFSGWYDHGTKNRGYVCRVKRDTSYLIGYAWESPWYACNTVDAKELPFQTGNQNEFEILKYPNGTISWIPAYTPEIITYLRSTLIPAGQDGEHKLFPCRFTYKNPGQTGRNVIIGRFTFAKPMVCVALYSVATWFQSITFELMSSNMIQDARLAWMGVN